MNLGPILRCLAGLVLASTAFPMTTPSEWQSLPPLPDPIGYGGMFAGVLHDRLVTGGGSQWDRPVWLKGAKSFTDRIWALSAPEGEWEQLPVKLPVPRGHFSFATAPGAIYLAGGIDASGCVKRVLVLQETDEGLTWASLPDLPVPVGYGTGAVAGRRLYVIGGMDDPASTKPSAAVWSLDLATANAAWEREADLPGNGIFVAAATGVGDQLVVLGGMTVDDAGKFQPSRAVWSLASSGGDWQPLPSLPEARVGAITPCPVLADGRVVIAGGYSEIIPGVQREHPGFNPRTGIFNPATGAWTAGPDIPHAPVPDRDSAGDPGPAPTLGAPAVVWRGLVVAISGEVRIATRSPQVLALPLPETRKP